MADPCATAPSATPTAGTCQSRFQQVWTWVKGRINTMMGAQAKAWDASDRTVEVRLIIFAIGAITMIAIIGLDYAATRKINVPAWTVVAGLISVGSISVGRGGER